MIVIAQLSDLHIDSGHRSKARTRAVMRYLDELPHDLDAIAVTGDIADHGAPEEYAAARELLVSRHPVLVCPGNHDVRGPFRRVLLGGSDGSGSEAEAEAEAAPAPVNQVLETERFTLALCDSSVPGEHHGRIDDATLAWLDGVLGRALPGVPALVGFHHPPVVVHNSFVDHIRQVDEERLTALADRHPNLLAFLAGHAHTPAATVFAGRPLLVAPGVVSTLRLPWEHGPGRESAVHEELPPALLFHVIGEDGRLTTHYRCVA